MGSPSWERAGWKASGRVTPSAEETAVAFVKSSVKLKLTQARAVYQPDAPPGDAMNTSFFPLTIGLIKRGSRFARCQIQLRGCESWPLAEGKIFMAKVGSRQDFGWFVNLTYSYSAEGEYYSGNFQQDFLRKKTAEAYAERFPSGTQIPVRYRPGRPETSAVVPQDLHLLLAGL
jgi:uncharacterized protein DUF3592